MTAPTNHQTNESTNQHVTPDLVRKVTDKVYEMWLKEIEIERERFRGKPKRGKR